MIGSMLDRQSKKTPATSLRHQVYIQTVTTASDGEGGHTQAWTDDRVVWASVDPIQARQRLEYASISVEATHLVRVRGEETISEESRIRFGSRYFEILTVENIQERGVLKVITCRELRGE